VAQLQQATSMIPAGACVSADPGLAIWLANREQINDFPDMLDRACYVVLDHHAYISGPTDPVVRADARDALPASGRTIVYDDGRFQVWSPVP
jgi:NaMN:DMB phosphoribosyltransferase